MPLTQPFTPITIRQPSSLMPLSNFKFNPPSTNKVVDQDQTMAISTSFIQQQIDIYINDLMYHMSKQLAKIVKPMV